MDVYVAIAIATGVSSEHASGLVGKPFHALAVTCSIQMRSILHWAVQQIALGWLRTDAW